jgi:hypothetical protein
VQGEVDAVRLRAVAQRGVEEKEAFTEHGVSPEVIIRNQCNGDRDCDQRGCDMMGFQGHDAFSNQRIC